MTPQLSLLPTHVRNRQMLWEVARFWLRIGAAAGAASLLFTWQQWSRLQSSERELSELRASQEVTRNVLRQVKRSRAQLQAARNEDVIVLSEMAQQPLLTLLDAVGAAAEEAGEEVVVERMAMQPADKLNTHAAGTTRAARQDKILNQRVELRGIGADNVAVTEFVAALRQSNLFERVDLTSTGSSNLRDRTIRSFVIECDY